MIPEKLESWIKAIIEVEEQSSIEARNYIDNVLLLAEKRKEKSDNYKSDNANQKWILENESVKIDLQIEDKLNTLIESSKY